MVMNTCCLFFWWSAKFLKMCISFTISHLSYISISHKQMIKLPVCWFHVAKGQAELQGPWAFCFCMICTCCILLYCILCGTNKYIFVVAEIVEMPFYLISFEYLCMTDEKNYLPREIGIVEWNMSQGITKVLHRFIDPGMSQRITKVLHRFIDPGMSEGITKVLHRFIDPGMRNGHQNIRY